MQLDLQTPSYILFFFTLPDRRQYPHSGKVTKLSLRPTAELFLSAMEDPNSLWLANNQESVAAQFTGSATSVFEKQYLMALEAKKEVTLHLAKLGYAGIIALPVTLKHIPFVHQET